MLIHPLLLAVIVLDVATAVLLVLAAVTAARVVVGWSPGAPTSTQLVLERRTEAASIQGRFAVGLFVLASLVWVVALSGVLPAIVPGAMCGTGVIQATGGLASRALALRLLALILLGAWHLYDRLDRRAPRGPLVPTVARIFLLAAPVTVVAALATWTSIGALDVHTPVDCCAVVFDSARTVTEATTTAGLSDGVLVTSTIALGALLGLLALWLLVTPGGPSCRGTLAAVTAAVWVPLATVTLVYVASAYHYGVLSHHCPWCLLSDHHLVGYPLFGALLVVLMDGLALVPLVRLPSREPALRAAVTTRIRRGALRILVAATVYGALTGIPPLVWRLQYGVWMSG